MLIPIAIGTNLLKCLPCKLLQLQYVRSRQNLFSLQPFLIHI